MKIALIDPRGKYGYGFTFGSAKIREPLGLEYIGAVAKQEGHMVKIWMQTEPDYSRLLNEVTAFGPDVVGLSSMTYNFNEVQHIARLIKSSKRNTYVVLGGEFSIISPNILDSESIDCVVVGEGEKTFMELLNAILNGKDINLINGLAYFDEKTNKMVLNEPQKRIKDLDTLPFPLRDKNILRRCIDNGVTYPPPSEQNNHACMIYSRGCPYACNFCTSPLIWGKKVIWRSAKNVVEEMEQLVNDFKSNYLFFCDLTFNVNQKKIMELCKEIGDRKLKVSWGVEGRVDLVNHESLMNMKKSGCRKISYGVESINDLELKKINKRQTLEQVISAFELANNGGMLTRASYMIGYPDDSEEYLEYLKKNIAKIPADELRISFITPFPGTKFYDDCDKDDILATYDFEKYTTDEPVIKTSVTREKLLNARMDIMRCFYQSNKYERQMKKKIKLCPDFKKSYEEYLTFLSEMKLF